MRKWFQLYLFFNLCIFFNEKSNVPCVDVTLIISSARVETEHSVLYISCTVYMGYCIHLFVSWRIKMVLKVCSKSDPLNVWVHIDCGTEVVNPDKKYISIYTY